MSSNHMSYHVMSSFLEGIVTSLAVKILKINWIIICFRCASHRHCFGLIVKSEVSHCQIPNSPQVTSYTIIITIVNIYIPPQKKSPNTTVKHCSYDESKPPGLLRKKNKKNKGSIKAVASASQSSKTCNSRFSKRCLNLPQGIHNFQ